MGDRDTALVVMANGDKYTVGAEDASHVPASVDRMVFWDVVEVKTGDRLSILVSQISTIVFRGDHNGRR